MKQLLLGLSAALLTLCSPLISAETTDTFRDYQHQGKKFPPVYFITNIEEVDIKEILDAENAFEALDKEAVGAPLAVIAVSDLRMKSDATAFSSLMLSASTLGLVPIVSNKEYKVAYFIYAGGDLVDKYVYSMTSSDVENMWSGRPRDKDELKPAEELFLEQTASEFLNEVAENQKLKDLFDEYYLYASRE